VTPWGKFVPALNALIRYASVECKAQLILFVSAETEASASSVSMLVNEVDSSTLVAGAVLPGHDYHRGEKVPLNGRNTPWNTLAVWNLPNLALNGFPMVSDGVHLNQDGRYYIVLLLYLNVYVPGRFSTLTYLSRHTVRVYLE
jgi:hypothetical protein